MRELRCCNEGHGSQGGNRRRLVAWLGCGEPVRSS